VGHALACPPQTGLVSGKLISKAALEQRFTPIAECAKYAGTSQLSNGQRRQVTFEEGKL
jgi:hypothetical protein